MSTNRLYGVTIVTGLALLVCAQALAIGPPANLLDLARHAKFVVIATVSDLHTCPTEEGHIFTYVTFKDVKALEKEGGANAKEPPREIMLRVPGGMVDGRVEVVTDAPIFRAGERVLLFLTRDPQQQVPIVQGTNGVVLVGEDGYVRAYSGALISAIDRNFNIVPDPGHRPNPGDARHWDPNMVAVWKAPSESTFPGEPPTPQKVGEPMTLAAFSERLREAWRAADKLGRLPEKLDYAPRRPYGEMPTAPEREN